jgi:hypothetical protein
MSSDTSTQPVPDVSIDDVKTSTSDIKNYIYSGLVYSQTDMLTWNLMQSRNAYQRYLFVQALNKQAPN